MEDKIRELDDILFNLAQSKETEINNEKKNRDSTDTNYQNRISNYEGQRLAYLHALQLLRDNLEV